jgi:hypothetical protein
MHFKDDWRGLLSVKDFIKVGGGQAMESYLQEFYIGCVRPSHLRKLKSNVMLSSIMEFPTK